MIQDRVKTFQEEVNELAAYDLTAAVNLVSEAEKNLEELRDENRRILKEFISKI